VCNVSRTVVAWARERYARVRVVLITASKAVLERRLAGRARPEDGVLEERLQRAPALDVGADVTIENEGAPEEGARRLLDAIYDRTCAAHR
jgi:ribose 1,5-bisphosphokinase